MSSLEDYLAARRREIDRALEQSLPTPAACHAPLLEAMQYSLMAGGKRMRPVLTLASAEAVAARHGMPLAEARAAAMPTACAIEMIHTYSLIHDDLPAMDDDVLRRGRPTVHVVYGEGMAILAGDGLQAQAFALLTAGAGVQEEHLAARQLRAVHCIAVGAGPEGMVGGQAIDLEAVAPVPGRAAPPRFDAEMLQGMHARKTGAMIRAAAAAGAIIAGGDAGEVVAIDRYAAEIGLAFQIVDDILDVEGQSEALGKTAGKDAAAGKPTYPALFGLERSRQLADECLDRAMAALASAEFAASRLADIAHWVVRRTS